MGGKYQLIDGEIIEMTSPTPNHQRIMQKTCSITRYFLIKTSDRRGLYRSFGYLFRRK
jgi:Uma2 family endonuclease